jgi:hypothetical protein
MRIEIPAITRPLKLSDYDPAFGDQTIYIWVNLPIDKLDEFAKMMREQRETRAGLNAAMKEKKPDQETIKNRIAELDAIGNQLINWLALVWSKGAPETHWDVAGVTELVSTLLDHDQKLYSWLIGQTWSIVTSYRAMQKKN